VSKPLSIAILGTRGIPARYGGFETFAEALAMRLAARGHRVTVYGRLGRVGREPEFPWPDGVASILLPAVPTKHLETVSHGLASAVHAAAAGYDVAIVCNQANAPLLPVLRAARIPAALCVDGFEEQRAKWGSAARSYLAFCRAAAVRYADALIADARVVAERWRDKSRSPVEYIPYGVDLTPDSGTDALDRLGLAPGGYVLYASRLEPENNAHLVSEAFARVRTDKRLAIVGDAPYARHYIRRLMATRDPRVCFVGGVYGRAYRQLQAHCAAYVQATEVGGTHPALLEGLAWSPCVVVHDTPENREVAGDAALFFHFRDADHLSRQIQHALDNPQLRLELAAKARERVRSQYDWNEVADRYEALLGRLAVKNKSSNQSSNPG